MKSRETDVKGADRGYEVRTSAVAESICTQDFVTLTRYKLMTVRHPSRNEDIYLIFTLLYFQVDMHN